MRTLQKVTFDEHQKELELLIYHFIACEQTERKISRQINATNII